MTDNRKITADMLEKVHFDEEDAQDIGGAKPDLFPGCMETSEKE